MRKPGSFVSEKGKKPMPAVGSRPQPKTDAEDVAAKRAAQEPKKAEKAEEVKNAVQ